MFRVKVKIGQFCYWLLKSGELTRNKNEARPYCGTEALDKVEELVNDWFIYRESITVETVGG